MTSLTQEWNTLFADIPLSASQQEQCKHYLALLTEWNEKFNITTVLGADAITYHFRDSFALMTTGYLAKHSPQRIVDVGSGGGFPGIPLKILLPDTPVVLIEVNQKKIGFLREVISQLGLKGIEVCTVDWRTFVSTRPYPADLFVSRASVKAEELVHVFTAFAYRSATVAYWAAISWEASQIVLPYMVDQVMYTIGDRERKLVFFKRPAPVLTPRRKTRN